MMGWRHGTVSGDRNALEARLLLKPTPAAIQWDFFSHPRIHRAARPSMPENYSSRRRLPLQWIRVATHTALPYNLPMYTVIETEVFQRYAADIWRDGEREAFILWLANNPLSGDVIPGSGGLRKVRWSRAGMGKRGGARVIYYNVLDDGCIWLLIAYTKAKFDNLPVDFLNRLREEVENG